MIEAPERICKNCIYWLRESSHRIKELQMRDAEVAGRFRVYASQTENPGLKRMYNRFADYLLQKKVFGRMVCEEPVTDSAETARCLNDRFIAGPRGRIL